MQLQNRCLHCRLRDDDNGDTDMPTSVILGEFEQLVLLGLLQLGDNAHALALLKSLEQIAGRSVSRGALYRTLDRLEEKGLVDWTLEQGTPERGGHPRRCYQVTAPGVQTLRSARDTLLKLWSGLEEVLG